MLKMLQSQNPDKEYPSNLGKKWGNEEEILLLEELSQNMDIEKIALIHDRTTGGILSRQREIAYKMYLKDIPIEEIIEKTKLDKEYITQTIDKRSLQKSHKKNINPQLKPITLESEIAEMKNEIKQLKNTIQELVEMMKAVYEFEDA